MVKFSPQAEAAEGKEIDNATSILLRIFRALSTADLVISLKDIRHEINIIFKAISTCLVMPPMANVYR
jgi:hypothetical protein